MTIPSRAYIGPVYAASVSLVEYLSSLKGTPEFTAFLREAGLRIGYEPAHAPISTAFRASPNWIAAGKRMRLGNRRTWRAADDGPPRITKRRIDGGRPRRTIVRRSPNVPQAHAPASISQNSRGRERSCPRPCRTHCHGHEVADAHPRATPSARRRHHRGHRPTRQHGRVRAGRTEVADDLLDDHNRALRREDLLFCTPVMPSMSTIAGAVLLRWAWMIATSGRIAGTAASCSPVNGHVTKRMLGLTFTRSEPW